MVFNNVENNTEYFHEYEYLTYLDHAADKIWKVNKKWYFRTRHFIISVIFARHKKQELIAEQKNMNLLPNRGAIKPSFRWLSSVCLLSIYGIALDIKTGCYLIGWNGFWYFQVPQITATSFAFNDTYRKKLHENKGEKRKFTESIQMSKLAVTTALRDGAYENVVAGFDTQFPKSFTTTKIFTTFVYSARFFQVYMYLL